MCTKVSGNTSFFLCIDFSLHSTSHFNLSKNKQKKILKFNPSRKIKALAQLLSDLLIFKIFVFATKNFAQISSTNDWSLLLECHWKCSSEIFSHPEIVAHLHSPHYTESATVHCYIHRPYRRRHRGYSERSNCSVCRDFPNLL